MRAAPEEGSRQRSWADRRSLQIGSLIGGAAVIIMLGNLSSSLLGFARQSMVLHVFGETSRTDAFFAASIVPQMFYDLTIGAAISAALIPTFSDLLEHGDEEAFWQTFGSVLILAWLALLAVVGALELAAQPVVTVILSGFQPQARPGAIQQAVNISRVLIPSLLFLGTSAVLLSALYSRRRFTVPAFATCCYHLGIIASAVILARPLGILALPAGALAGAVAQVAVQIPSLRRSGLRPRLRLQLTPSVRRIIRLYVPVALGLLVSIAGQIIDINFKWRLGNGGVTAMQTATMLTQFPIGIAVAALSFAILPSISADVAADRQSQYKDTVALGLRFVVFLTLPAAVAFIAVGTPIVLLLFQHGHFHHADTTRTATALAGYAIQIPFVGVDQLMIFSFYARKNTVTPMVIGVCGVLIYVASALLLMPRLHIFGLALANTIQNSLHALILLALLLLTVGTLSDRGILRSVCSSAVAAAVMAAVSTGMAFFLTSSLGTDYLLARAATAIVPLVLGFTAYLFVAYLAKSSELSLAFQLARRYLPR